MRTLAAAALFATALVAVPASQTAQNPRLSDSLERPFPANGQIRMDLSAGEYHVSGTNENRVASSGACETRKIHGSFVANYGRPLRCRGRKIAAGSWL